MRKNNWQKMIKIIFYYFMVFFLVNTAYGASLYITPEELFFDNVLVGGYAEQIITITTDSETPLQVTPKVAGEIASWVSFKTTSSLEVKNNVPLSLKVILTPPPDSPIGTYSGEVGLIFENKYAPLIGKENANMINLKTTVTLTLEKTKKLIINKIEALDTEVDHTIDFFIDVENQGNENLYAYVEVTIENKSLSENIELKPTEKKNILLSFPSFFC